MIGWAWRVMAVRCLPIFTVYQYCSKHLLDKQPQLFPLQLHLMILQMTRNRKRVTLMATWTNETLEMAIRATRNGETIRVCTLDAGLLAISQYSEGPATGHLDKGFSWFPCVYKQMLRWFPRFQVATTCFSCSPPDLNLVVTDFMYSLHVK